MMAATIDQLHCDPLAGAPAADSASITPPQSANGKTMAPEGVPSELSDLELDHKAAPAPETAEVKEEEVEDIEPDHYYGGGKIPVFKPVSALHVPHTKSWRYCALLRNRLTGYFRPWTNLETFRPSSRRSTNTECRQES
jgi:hypothetical protein